MSREKRSLYFLFDKNWTRGLELVDQRAVRCLVAQNSKRKVFQVLHQSNLPDLILQCFFRRCWYFTKL